MIFTYQESEPSHFERIPGILDYLTYIEQDYKIINVKLENGKASQVKELLFDENNLPIYVRKRLTPTHKEVYRTIKKLAGDLPCMRDTEYLARMCGCSKTSITDAKAALTQSFEQLEGNPLIYIDKKMTSTFRGGKAINKKPVHLCRMAPIWKYNNPFMEKIYKMSARDPNRLPPIKKERISVREAEISVEKMAQPSVREIVHNPVHENGGYTKNSRSQETYPENVTSSPGDISQKGDGQQTLKEPFVKTTNPTALAVQTVLLNKNVEDCFSCWARARSWLIEFGVSKKRVKAMDGFITLNEIINSIYYLKEQMKKKPIKGSATGYLLQIIHNQWWR